MAHIELIGLAEAKRDDGTIWKLPYAFPIIIAKLRKTEHTFNVVDTHMDKKSFDDIVRISISSSANVFGISAWSHNYLQVKILTQAIRKAKQNAIIIVGGIISGNDDVLLTNTETDIVSTAAEGEFVLIEILSAIDSGLNDDKLALIDGISFKSRNNGQIIKTNKRKTMTKEEFADSGMPAYDYFDKYIFEIANNINSNNAVPVKGFPLLVSRGCPFQCTFCGFLYDKKFLRKKWDDFFTEANYLVNRYGVEGFFSYDTNMFLNQKDVDEYCAHYRHTNSTFKICAEMRTTFGDYQMFKTLKEHGVLVVLLGLESGSAYMLKRMKKGFDVNKMKDVLESIVDAGVVFHGNFIFGTPGENKKTIMETARFMLFIEKLLLKQENDFKKTGEMATSGYGWSILVPSPPSELYRLAVEKQLIKNEEEYLLSLSDDDNMRLAKGKQFKIKLMENGGDVNMSEFRSKEALRLYVLYAQALVKFQTMWLYDTVSMSDIIKRTYVVFAKRVRYELVNFVDFILGKKGFFDEESRQKFEKYKNYIYK